MPPTSDNLKLRFHETEILLGAYALLELLGSGAAMSHWDRLETESVGIPWKPRDLANRRSLPRSQSKAFAAARQSLEADKLIQSIRAGWSESRVTHIRPTEAAIDLALELTAGGVDLAAIAAGLQRCEWAVELAKHAETLAKEIKPTN